LLDFKLNKPSLPTGGVQVNALKATASVVPESNHKPCRSGQVRKPAQKIKIVGKEAPCACGAKPKPARNKGAQLDGDALEPNKDDQPAALPQDPVKPTSASDLKEWDVDWPVPYLHVHLNPKMKAEWIKGYSTDHLLHHCWENPDVRSCNWRPGRRFVRNNNDLLYFMDADFVPRLCVPIS
jgi:hypothetical protein